MWTTDHRQAHGRKALRYPSDLTDAEWTLVAPLIPRRGGRPRDVNMREVLNAVFYLLSTGRQRDALPKDLPSKSTVYDYFRPDAARFSEQQIIGVLKARGGEDNGPLLQARDQRDDVLQLEEQPVWRAG